MTNHFEQGKLVSVLMAKRFNTKLIPKTRSRFRRPEAGENRMWGSIQIAMQKEKNRRVIAILHYAGVVLCRHYHQLNDEFLQSLFKTAFKKHF